MKLPRNAVYAIQWDTRLTAKTEKWKQTTSCYLAGQTQSQNGQCVYERTRTDNPS